MSGVHLHLYILMKDSVKLSMDLNIFNSSSVGKIMVSGYPFCTVVIVNHLIHENGTFDLLTTSPWNLTLLTGVESRWPQNRHAKPLNRIRSGWLTTSKDHTHTRTTSSGLGGHIKSLSR